MFQACRNAAEVGRQVSVVEDPMKPPECVMANPSHALICCRSLVSGEPVEPSKAMKRALRDAARIALLMKGRPA